MDMIKRYIYQVQKYLPESQREEVGKELQANLLDMMGEDPQEEEVLEALISLGHPKKLAREYSIEERYLIGPTYYDQYLEILKLVTSIVLVVMVVVQLLSLVFGHSSDGFSLQTFIQSVGKIVGVVLGAVLQSAFWVTFSFVMVERYGQEEGHKRDQEEDWSPKNLPAVPKVGPLKISKVEAAITLVVTVFVMALLVQGSDWIGVFYREGENAYRSIPLFSSARLTWYLPAFWFFAIAQVAMVLWQLMKKYWTMPMAMVNFLLELGFILLVMGMLLDPHLLDENLARSLADTFGASLENVNQWIGQGKFFTGLFVMVIGLLDAGSVVYKMWKSKKNHHG